MDLKISEEKYYENVVVIVVVVIKTWFVPTAPFSFNTKSTLPIKNLKTTLTALFEGRFIEFFIIHVKKHTNPSWELTTFVPISYNIMMVIYSRQTFKLYP